jgi:hypothetical protein
MVAVACGGSRPSVTPETEPTLDPAVTAPAFASSTLRVDGPRGRHGGRRADHARGVGRPREA